MTARSTPPRPGEGTLPRARHAWRIDRVARRSPPRTGLGPGSERARSTGRIGGRLSTRVTTCSADERVTGLFVFGGAVVVGALNALCEGGLIHNERRSAYSGL